MSAEREAIFADASDDGMVALAREIESRGFHVLSCTTGRDLRELTEARNPELVVVELRLADGPSLKHIERIKRLRSDVRVVVLTGHASVATAVQSARLGADTYLEKPATADAVLATPRADASDAEDGAWDAWIGEQPTALDRALWEYLHRAVAFSGSISAAGRLLGLDRRSLRRMLGRYAPRLRAARG